MLDSDDHYYQIQSERSQAIAEKETLANVYQALILEHKNLQSNFVRTHFACYHTPQLTPMRILGRYRFRKDRCALARS